MEGFFELYSQNLENLIHSLKHGVPCSNSGNYSCSESLLLRCVSSLRGVGAWKMNDNTATAKWLLSREVA